MCRALTHGYQDVIAPIIEGSRTTSGTFDGTAIMTGAVYTPPPFPTSRPRRLRRDEATRALVAEHRLHPSDFILPVFIIDGHDRAEDVASMPGVQRLTLDRLLPLAEECVRRGIPVMALFPVLDASLKSADGREALNPEGLIPRSVAAL